MATVTLSASRVRDAAVPPVCTVCGKDADHLRPEQFVKSSSLVVFLVIFVGVLPGVLLHYLTRRRMTVPMPLCGRHFRRANRRQSFAGYGLAAAAVVGLAGAGVYKSGNTEVGGYLLAGAAGLLILVGFVVMAVDVTGARVVEITDRQIVLEGVSEEFADALEGSRDSGPAPAEAQGAVGLTTAKYLRPRY